MAILKVWPFKETANYLGMDFLSNLHTVTGENYEMDLPNFINLIDQVDLPKTKN